MAGDTGPAKITIHVNVVPVVLATRDGCTSQGQSVQKGTLATFTLSIEPGYECIEDIQTIQADLDMKAINSAEFPSQARPRAVLIRHTYIAR
jgi:hypothetical protein